MAAKQTSDTVKRILNAPPVTLIEIAEEAGLPPSTLTRLKAGTYKVHDRHADAILDALETLRDRYREIARDLDAAAKRIRRTQHGRRR